jgi:uncharacterized membrane protein
MFLAFVVMALLLMALQALVVIDTEMIVNQRSNCVEVMVIQYAE